MQSKRQKTPKAINTSTDAVEACRKRKELKAANAANDETLHFGPCAQCAVQFYLNHGAPVE